MAVKNVSIEFQGKTVHVAANEWAEQANGSAVVKLGDTTVLVTAVLSKNESQNQGFFPLTVDYEERFYAARRILGSRFMRREGRPSDDAIITARVVDRAIRPLFPQYMRREVQVIATCLAWDGENDPDVLSLLGASCALSISDIPWDGPVAVVRVAHVDGKFVMNPTYEERAKSKIDFIVAGVLKNGKLLVNMVEAEADEVPESLFREALKAAEPELIKAIQFQTELQREIGKEKVQILAPVIADEVKKFVTDTAREKLRSALFTGDKLARMDAVNDLKREVAAQIEVAYPDMGYAGPAKDFFESEIDRIVHEEAILNDKRVDDRAPDEVRQLSAEAGVLQKTHGSALFTRGQTKTLSILTLGAPGDQKILEGMEFIGKKRFMHHYNFPPYSSGETKPMRGPGRREIGHGALAEKALFPVIPTFDEFPYTIRIVTEVVSSNGSTSQASVCSSSLALMDAGVPIKRPVAGISMGLMSTEDGAYKILSDIQGPEDHHGDMDFKVAGTREGITAIQLDVKTWGISENIFAETLERAKKVRVQILDQAIEKTLPAPRAEISKWAPRISVLRINPEKIGLVIGGGGKTINKIIDMFKVAVDIEEDGAVFVTGEKDENVKNAIRFIEGLTREAKVGEQYEGRVTRLMNFGAFVEIWPGQEGLVHISQISNKRIEQVSDILKVGDRVLVKVIEIDDQGRVNLSMKDAPRA